MGCNGIGAAVATTLVNQGHTVHVLDSHEGAFGRLPPGGIEEGHIVPIIGDGTLQQGLVKASVQDADVFMALSNSDTRNALAAQRAKQVYQVPKVICRIDDPDLNEMYNELDIQAVGATMLVTEMLVKETNA